VDFDAGQIMALITAASMCGDCLARKTGPTARRIDGVLNGPADSVVVNTTPGRCNSCLKETVVHRLG
jgi:hypothetical protein